MAGPHRADGRRPLWVAVTLVLKQNLLKYWLVFIRGMKLQGQKYKAGDLTRPCSHQPFRARQGDGGTSVCSETKIYGKTQKAAAFVDCTPMGTPWAFPRLYVETPVLPWTPRRASIWPRTSPVIWMLTLAAAPWSLFPETSTSLFSWSPSFCP
jgi:hypothetical protein